MKSNRETYKLLKEDSIDVLSIGYRTIKDAWDHERNARSLKEAVDKK